MGRVFFVVVVFITGLITSSCNVLELATTLVPEGEYPNAPSRQGEGDWTLMFYYNADNNLEEYMLEDMAEIQSALSPGYSLRVLVLIDRIPGFSTSTKVFGEDFTDTRLYELTAKGPIRLSGGVVFPELNQPETSELDMGEIQNLQKFIQWSKHYSPARNYGLIMGNHGSGLGDLDLYGARGISYDDTNRNYITLKDFQTQMSPQESVDLLVFDACSMNYVELAYQLAPLQGGIPNTGFSAQWMVASPVEVVAEGFAYNLIFQLLLNAFDQKRPVAPTPAEVGTLFLEGQQLYLKPLYETGSTFQYTSFHSIMTYSVINLSQLDQFKTQLDQLATQLTADKSIVLSTIFGTAIGQSISNSSLLYYFDESSLFDWQYYPGVDAYSLLEQLAKAPEFSPLLPQIETCLESLDAALYDSFASADYPRFLKGKNGLALFFPKGNLLRFGKPLWSHQTWYSPDRLKWCEIGQQADNAQVDNYFELLDTWW